MAGNDEGPKPTARPPNVQQLRHAIDAGRTGDKVAFFDPAASPLGTDDEAAGHAATPEQVATALRQELNRSTGEPSAAGLPAARQNICGSRPVSPNIQVYRPQLTSVLSIANRITGVVLSLGAVGLVTWLIAAASGPKAYAAIQGATFSWIGQVVLFGFTFSFFMHLCGGIRHLVWDTVHGFELRSIYVGGWTVVAASVLLTTIAWAASFYLAG